MFAEINIPWVWTLKQRFHYEILDVWAEQKTQSVSSKTSEQTEI